MIMARTYGRLPTAAEVGLYITIFKSLIVSEVTKFFHKSKVSLTVCINTTSISIKFQNIETSGILQIETYDFL